MAHVHRGYLLTYQSLVDILYDHAQHRPDQLSCAYLGDGLTISHALTYAELYQKAAAIANRLRKQTEVGQTVLLLFPNNLEFIAAFWGCLMAERIAIPAYPPQMGKRPDRLFHLYRDGQAAAILTIADLKPSIESLFSGQPMADRVMATDEIAALTSMPAAPKPLAASQTAFLQYTSGSTQHPRGVEVTHDNLWQHRGVFEALFPHHPSIWIGWTPLYHDLGLIGSVLYPLSQGGTIYLMTPQSFLQHPERWLQAVGRYGATIIGCPNFGYQWCVDKVPDSLVAELDLSSLQVAFCGAEPIRWRTMQAFWQKFGAAGLTPDKLHGGYGLAEATLAVSGRKASPQQPLSHLMVDRAALGQGRLQPAADGASLVGCGQVSGNQQVLIVEPETARVRAPGEVGEVWIRSLSVAKGYWRQPEATARTFAAYTADGEGPFLRSGDLGAFWRDELFITGRLKDLIIIRGQNYHPTDLEELIRHHLRRESTVSEVLVAGQSDEHGTESLVVLLESRKRKVAPQTAEAIFAGIQHMVSHELNLSIARFCLMPRKSIRKTTSGKVQRQATYAQILAGEVALLADQWHEVHHREFSFEARLPQSRHLDEVAAHIREWIVQWVAAKLALNPQKISPSDALQWYGLDSMRLQEFESELSLLLGQEWAVQDYLLMEPSIEEIARQGALRVGAVPKS